MTAASLILSGVGAVGAVGSALSPWFGAGDDAVALGGVVLEGFVAPERMNWGGTHQLTVHKFPGGKRQVDAMGRDDDDIRFSGRLIGRDRDLAAAIDAVRVAGEKVTLAWNDRAAEVVIRAAHFADTGQGTTYEIECVVVRDLSASYGEEERDLLGQIVDDIGQALTLASQGLALYATGDAIITSLSGLQAKTEPLTTFVAGADPDSIATDAAAVATSAAVLLADRGAVLDAGISSSDPDAVLAQFTALRDATEAAAAAVIAGVMAARIVVNAAAVNGQDTAQAWVPEGEAIAPPPRVGARIVVAGADLYRLAALQLRDATQWVRIAEANGLDDPMIAGVAYLTIPAARPGTGLPDDVTAL